MTTGNSAYVLSGSTGSWTSGTLSTGTYKWRAKAYDTTDLSKAWSSWRTLVVDPTAPTAPTVTSTSHASSTSWYAANDFTGTLTASDTSSIVGYAVKIDQNPSTSAGTTVTQTTTAVTASDKADGTWYVHAAAKNAAGLWSATRTFTFNIDTTAPGTPTVSSSTHPLSTATYASRAASFSWTAPSDRSGAAAYTVSVDQSATTLPSSGGTTQTTTAYSTTVSADGTWYLHVRAKDAAGNWSASAAHFAFTVDSTLTLLPTIKSTTHPDQTSAYNSGALTATWTTSGTATGYSYAVDSSATTVPDTTSDTTSAAYSGTKAEGTWYLHVRAVNSSGTWGATAHYRFTVDTTAPAAPTVGSADFPTDSWTGDAGDTGVFTLTSNDSRLAKLSYSLDGATATSLTVSAATTSITLTPADEGSHLLAVTATDKAGNVSAVTSYTFHVGTAGLTAPLNGEEVGYAATLAAAGPSDLTGATFQYRRSDAEAWADIPATDVVQASDGGAVTWPVTMTDGVAPELTWNTGGLAADGDLELRVVFGGANSPAPSEAVTALLTRVDLLGDTSDDTTEPTTVQSYALDAAETRAEANPDNFAPPYLDESSGNIVAPVTDLTAEDDASETISLTGVPADIGTDDDTVDDAEEAADGTTDTEDGIADAAATVSVDVTPATGVVAHSQAELESISDEILLLDDTDIPGASALATAGVDAETNRVVVQTATEDQTLADLLGQRYGTDTIAIQVSPGVGTIQQAAGRWDDTTPYKGGAAFRAGDLRTDDEYLCTTGFAWKYNGHPYMVSAGHCTTSTGYMDSWDPDLTIGYVSADNWANSSGSVKLSGQGYYSGDLSLTEIIENKYNVSARIYKGTSESKTMRRVEGRWTTRSKAGEQFCSGGTRTGEVCGWKVTGTKKKVKYKEDGKTYVAQNMTIAQKNSGRCIKKGDSGGPVYTVKKNGHAYAKGIISGSECDSVTDDGECSDAWDGKCTIIFTDISLAEKALPGAVKLW